MRQLLVALLLCVSIAASACGSDYRCDADGGVMYTAERVVDLPQDQDRWYCSIIGSPGDPQVQQLNRWFNENPELNRIKRGTHFSTIDSTSLMYESRYAATSGKLPCLRLQDSKGVVVYQVSGRNVPLTPEGLCNSIRSTCHRRQAQPQPSGPNMNIHYHFDVPHEQEPAKPDDDVFAPEEPDNLAVWILIGAGVLAVVGGVAYEWRKSNQA